MKGTMWSVRKLLGLGRRAALQACDLPAEIRRDARLTYFKGVLKGHFTLDERDRSGYLYRLAHEMAGVAGDRGYELPPEVAAGVLKKFDMGVYTNRPDADQQYRRLARMPSLPYSKDRTG